MNRIVSYALAAALTFPALQYGALSGSGDDTVERMADLVRQYNGEPGRVASYGVLVRNLIFYTGIRQQILWNEDELVKYLARPERVLAVSDRRLVEAHAERPDAGR